MKITKLFMLSVLTIALLSCKNDDEEISLALPTISTITPASVTVGSPLIINGSNFSDDLSQNAVRFFQESTSENSIITKAGKSFIHTSIPANLAPGEYSLEVTVAGKSVIASNKIVVVEGVFGIASISSIAPAYGEVASEFLISGLNFSTTPENYKVSFVKEDNSLLKATVISATSTAIKVKVPEAAPGAYSIRVEIGGKVVNTSAKYTIKPSVIVSNFYPVSGEKGTNLSIYGSNFSLIKSENSVYFISYNSVVEAPVLAATTSLLNVEVPANIKLGDFIVKVMVNGKSVSTQSPFRITPTVLPTIAGFSSVSVYSGATLTLNGSNFGSHIEHLQVFFVNGTLEEKGVILNASSDYITLIVPSLANGSYNLKVYKYDEPVMASSKITSNEAPFTITDFAAGESSIELSGSGFKTTIEDNIVEFVQAGTSISAEVIDASGDLLEVLVPESLHGEYYIKVTIESESVTLPDTYVAY